ncbi:MAG: ABC transporter permease [Firmicutes bacterium]|nr:ABC transporter permease [Bacillota bacterium]
MNFFDTARLALGNIRASKMRTFLTMLGIIIGVSAVILIEGLGNGMQVYMEDAFESLGTNTIQVMILGRGSSRSVSVDQMYQIAADNPESIENVSPTVSVSLPVKVGTETLSSTSVTGVGESYLDMKTYTLSMGRGLQFMDIKDRKAVCVVGEYIDLNYYGGNAVGNTLKLGTHKLTIVGVMTQEEDEMNEGGTDDCVYLPYSTAARWTGRGKIGSYMFTSTDKDHSEAAVTAIENGLFEVFEDDKSYTVISMAQLLDTFTTMLNVMITILAVIAGISLVVGGIGIMNIMLVSVTERTREIGIRKALGAKERVIMAQFVTEAAVTSLLGGAIGIGFGMVLCRIGTMLVARLTEVDMQVVPSIPSIIMAAGVSAAIGIMFGWLPARKAANLNPIDALRYE